MGCRADSRALLASICLTAGLAATASVAATREKGAAPAESMIPLPPPRPAELGRRHEGLVLRGVTEARTPAPVHAVAIATLPRPLPPATRERMHACGLEWQQIKWSGSAGEKTWRNFAMECLPR